MTFVNATVTVPVGCVVSGLPNASTANTTYLALDKVSSLIVEVVREAYPDHTALDPKDPHYDPQSKGGESSWSMVDVHAIERLPRSVALSELRTKPELEGMPLLKKGNRLSVQKVGAAEWNAVVALAKETAR